MSEELVLSFIKQHKLDPSIASALRELLKRHMFQMSETLDADLKRALSSETTWKPVVLTASVVSEEEPTAPQETERQVPPHVSLRDIQPGTHIDEDLFIPEDLDTTMEVYRLTTSQAPPPNDDDDDEVAVTLLEGQLPPHLRAKLGLPGPPQAKPPKSFSKDKDEDEEDELYSMTLADASGLEIASMLPANLPSRSAPFAPHAPEIEDDILISSKLPRYQRLAIIGEGATGEIWRVLDRDLNRTMAMKIMKPSLREKPTQLARFIEEAQITAQLEHPGIVPIHECGRLSDGRYYFTMKEIKGQSLSEVIDTFHDAATTSHWGTTPEGWNLRRLLDLFKRICEAIGYAHSHKVIHRDLKPDNIIVGQHGEVHVVDWGLVKILEPEPTSKAEQDFTQTSKDQGLAQPLTLQGDLLGTPAYMSPEQLTSPDQVNEQCDVYSLGVILYEILAGQVPYVGYNHNSILFQILSGPPYPPGREEVSAGQEEDKTLWRTEGTPPSHVSDKPLLPEGLISICARAMHRKPSERYENANAFAQAIREWLNGAKRLEQAFSLVGQAETREPEIWLLQTQATQARQKAQELAKQLEPWDPEQNKWPVWEEEERAKELEKAARQLSFETESILQSALAYVPDLAAAHEALVLRYQSTHKAAEEAGHTERRQHLEEQLKKHLHALPSDNTSRNEVAAYLKGDGAISLITDPPGANVQVYRFVKKHRRLVPEFVKHLGQTPLRQASLPMGSYLLKLHAKGYEEVNYPVYIGRQEHWDGHPPGAPTPHVIRLPQQGAIKEGERYIPAGYFQAGDKEEHGDALPSQRIWMHDFVIQTQPVINREYDLFLAELRKAGRFEEAEQYAPQGLIPSTSGETPSPFRELLHTGRWNLTDEHDEPIWPALWPVVRINWFGARAYAKWYSERTRQTWRLAFELEWEKAARGVDGRLYPWGDFLDPTWCHMRESQHGVVSPTSIQDAPLDVSVYGVRHMGGNVMDWCLDAYHPAGPPVRNGVFSMSEAWEASLPHTIALTPPYTRRLRRGGAWGSNRSALRSSDRNWSNPGHPFSLVGFRLVRLYHPSAS